MDLFDFTTVWQIIYFTMVEEIFEIRPFETL